MAWHGMTFHETTVFYCFLCVFRTYSCGERTTSPLKYQCLIDRKCSHISVSSENPPHMGEGLVYGWYRIPMYDDNVCLDCWIYPCHSMSISHRTVETWGAEKVWLWCFEVFFPFYLFFLFCFSFQFFVLYCFVPIMDLARVASGASLRKVRELFGW